MRPAETVVPNPRIWDSAPIPCHLPLFSLLLPLYPCAIVGWSLASWPIPGCGTGRVRANGLWQGCRWEMVRVAGLLVTAQPEKEVSGHIHDGPGVIQLVELGARV